MCHFILSNIPSSERTQKKLKDSLEKFVDLKGQPHDSREQLSIMNLSMPLYNLLFTMGDTI